MTHSISKRWARPLRDWIVVSKPSGILTIPGRDRSEEALSDLVAAEYGPVWTVHRLDRDTSGVVVFARSAEAHKRANAWFRERKVRKTYECLAQGILSQPVMKIATPIDGAPSTTQVEVLESYQEGFLARVRPLTGRMHQIRIHLSSEGHPLWGDTKYGGPKAVTIGGVEILVPRVALHAAMLEFPTGEKFEAPRPEDFATWIDLLRKDGRRV